MTTIAASEYTSHERLGLGELNNKALDEWVKVDAVSGKQTSDQMTSVNVQSDQQMLYR